MLVEAGVAEEVADAVCPVVVGFSVGPGLLLPTTVPSSYPHSVPIAEGYGLGVGVALGFAWLNYEHISRLNKDFLLSTIWVRDIEFNKIRDQRQALTVGSKVTTSANVSLDCAHVIEYSGSVPTVMPTNPLAQQKCVPYASYIFQDGSAHVGDAKTVLVQFAPAPGSQHHVLKYVGNARWARGLTRRAADKKAPSGTPCGTGTAARIRSCAICNTVLNGWAVLVDLDGHANTPIV